MFLCAGKSAERPNSTFRRLWTRQMSMGYRIFAVEEDDQIVSVSQKSFNDFYFKHKPSLGRFSERIVHFAIVFYTLAGREPNEIVRIDSMRLKVNPEGALDLEHYYDGLSLVARRLEPLFGDVAVEPTSASSGPVINAVAIFDEKRQSQLHPKLSGPVHKRILHALFGSGAHA